VICLLTGDPSRCVECDAPTDTAAAVDDSRRGWFCSLDCVDARLQREDEQHVGGIYCAGCASTRWEGCICREPVAGS